ncbi:MAG: tRNA (adenosine(37)-N6)-threonylcarbamoyltransferase complex transferase subunit TsaD [Candidatus Paceibacterota bacterium]
MIILGIETSCDETAVAIIEGNGNDVRVLSNIVSSQIDIHKKYGGVVPEIAAREHVLNILPVVNEAFKKAGIKRAEAGKKIDAIAVTFGPGLITSLIVGIETAKVLSSVLKIPLVAVNHIEGHIYANFVGKKDIKFPGLILTVSGGHTMLVLMKGHGKYKVIGDTRDDAAGEAFDKAAKLLNISYPGGPAVAAEAKKFKVKNLKSKIQLPRPMINSNDYDFSFSGLKTALFYQLKKDKNWKKRVPEYCAEFQEAVVDVLVSKTIKAAKDFGVKTVLLAGGVSANEKLREKLKISVAEELPRVEFSLPDLKYTTDNAVMVAVAGYFRALKKDFIPYEKIKVDPNLELR